MIAPAPHATHPPAIPGDPADITPAQWEARRWAVFGMAPPPPHKKRGRKPHTHEPAPVIFANGKPPRPRRDVDGVTLWACNDAEHRGARWLPATEFYRRESAPEGLQPKCKACARRICAERTARLRAERMEVKAG